MIGAQLFGKLPAHGDFIARGLMPAERDALDDWLAASLARAQQRLGDRFGDAFDAAPAWRFAERRDDGWLAGALAPSIDSAGRRYPILAVRQARSADYVAATAKHCEGAIYDALGGGWDADTLAAGIEAPPTSQASAEDAWNGGEGWWSLGGGGFAPSHLPGRRPSELLAAMLTMREVEA